MTRLIVRPFRPSDAHGVSRLFREVYGSHYVQPDVYLPNMISQHNTEGRWQSMLAVDDARVLGHAALCRDIPSSTAELALSVVHPAAQGQSIATRLGQQLLMQSDSLGLKSASIKQVTHHPFTQRMAERIGFYSTGLLPDYVPSPFAESLPETIVMGYHMIGGYARPLPDIPWPASCRAFLQHLCSVFGTHRDKASQPAIPLQIKQHQHRFDIVIQRLNKHLLEQLWQLPRHWLISARLELSWHFARNLRSLSALGFTFTGLMPMPSDNGWFALFHRGVQSRSLNLHCAHMQQLHNDLQQNANALLVTAQPRESFL
ncbi:GNAT family N-acetyltransferase [Pseudomonas lini]|uniref:GNAT family N-acetyltransferase n=1 Tax=Pseudomonas lini TaxID=163011 RepID=A0A0J6JX92_9PSED|nr:GNAT family N-acetyltransferase [Pseudomonas lini]KAB0507565.1 GNAT family N-acetyltransferase [Pseudomonas lini]KMM88447.1 GCN5 family acetyltransferase [Pseudomonas lini]KNH46078.1 GCN5 family acetyltransferase [Pseudomonas lini]SDT42554.1 Predicted N-acetyltransferase YhbS [Pseudomonas lini]